MGKDKKKKKENDNPIKEYKEMLDLLKAKNIQADGYLQELKVKLKEIESLKNELKETIEANRKITREMSL